MFQTVAMDFFSLTAEKDVFLTLLQNNRSLNFLHIFVFYAMDQIKELTADRVEVMKVSFFD